MPSLSPFIRLLHPSAQAHTHTRHVSLPPLSCTLQRVDVGYQRLRIAQRHQAAPHQEVVQQEATMLLHDAMHLNSQVRGARAMQEWWAVNSSSWMCWCWPLRRLDLTRACRCPPPPLPASCWSQLDARLQMYHIAAQGLGQPPARESPLFHEIMRKRKRKEILASIVADKVGRGRGAGSSGRHTHGTKRRNEPWG